MKKILYFIAQLIIGWIEYEKPKTLHFDWEKNLNDHDIQLERIDGEIMGVNFHAYQKPDISVNATDETQPIKIHAPTKKKKCSVCQATGKVFGEWVHDDIVFYNDCPACGGSGLKMDDTQPMKVRYPRVHYPADQIKPKRKHQLDKRMFSKQLVGYLLDNKYTISLFEYIPDDAWCVPVTIPPAGEELEMLKYPENKPDGFGPYWAHLRQDNKGNFQDRWIRMEWWETRWGCDIDKYSRNIDYFINYRLEG